nr:hypothetical protein [Tanacetum cinerariifolium]
MRPCLPERGSSIPIDLFTFIRAPSTGPPVKKLTVHDSGDFMAIVPASPSSTMTTDTTSGEFGKKSGRTVTLTAEDMQKNKNDVKARTTLLLSLPDEHQLRFICGRALFTYGLVAAFIFGRVVLIGDRVGWDWSYMVNNEEDHALVADEVAPTEFDLMANTSAESKDLDNLIESQRSDKNKDGLGYIVVPPPPPAQLYLSSKKDLSWTGLPECADDTVTNYSRPSPTVEST